MDYSEEHKPIPKQTFLHEVELLETFLECAAEVLLDLLFDLLALLKSNHVSEELGADEDREDE